MLATISRQKWTYYFLLTKSTYHTIFESKTCRQMYIWQQNKHKQKKDSTHIFFINVFLFKPREAKMILQLRFLLGVTCLI